MRLSANRTCVSRSSTAPLAPSCGLRAVTCERHTARPPSLPGNRCICSLAACLPIFSTETRRIWIVSEVSRRAARVHKFFLRHFFASCKQAPRSSGLGEELGESDLAELDGAGHQPPTAEGNAPAARARDLGDEAVGV